MTQELRGYRDRVYEEYGRCFQDQVGFNPTVAARWGSAYRHFLRGWLPEDLDAPILDVACGNGKLLHTLRGWGYRNIAGVDVSADQVRIARQAELTVDHTDALEHLRQREGCYALIIALDFVEHLYKTEVIAFFDAVHSALRVGGRLVLQTPNGDSPFGASVRYGDFTHEVCFTPNSLARLLTVSSFTDISARDTAPFPHGTVSLVRAAAWRVCRAIWLAYNLVETGSKGSGILTRTFLMTARKC